MEIRVFGILASTLGRTTVELADEPADVDELLAKLRESEPDIEIFLDREKVAVAINHEFVKDNTPIKPGDEVALLPPVSGG